MTVRLRPHHLLCMLTFSGEGYSPSFSGNFDEVVRRLNAGEDIEIVSGPDDICRPLLNDPDSHCTGESVDVRDRDAAQDVGQVLGRPVRELTCLPDLATLRAAFAAGDTRRGCQGCEWFGLCSDVAHIGYRSARLGRA